MPLPARSKYFELRAGFCTFPHSCRNYNNVTPYCSHVLCTLVEFKKNGATFVVANSLLKNDPWTNRGARLIYACQLIFRDCRETICLFI